MTALSRVAGVFLVSLVISWLLNSLVLWLAPRLHMLDVPNERKVHQTPIPRGGGVAIFLGLATALVLFHDLTTRFMILGLFICVLGLIDDIRSLPWYVRLLVQFLAAGAIVQGWGEADLFVRLFGLLWIVGLTNAFNMLDNMDALSAGVAWIACAFLAMLSADWIPYLALMGALTGFLWFNRPPALLFMGDAGSTFLGFFLAVRSAEDLALGQNSYLAWLTPIVLLAVPLYDMTSVVLLRLRQGRSPFHPDKQHVSHRLVRLGLSSTTAVSVIYVLAAAGGVASLVVSDLSYESAMLFVVQFLCWWLALAVVEYLPLFTHK